MRDTCHIKAVYIYSVLHAEGERERDVIVPTIII